jgi:pseudouridine-5'-phosphate glycosidase/pseudouridine kinase
VGKNVALAAQLAGAKVRLISAVSSDLAGKWVIQQMEKNGMDTGGIEVREEGSTARYVAVNGGMGELFVACADMKVVEKMDPGWVRAQMERSRAKYICVDGNLSPVTLQEILKVSTEVDANGSSSLPTLPFSSLTYTHSHSHQQCSNLRSNLNGEIHAHPLPYTPHLSKHSPHPVNT